MAFDPISNNQRIKKWLLEDEPQNADQGSPGASDQQHHQTHQYPWWKVVCLTGVDYFSTLGYQPGIAALAAGILSPVATMILVLVTLFAALPVYLRVASESPHGNGSISMLERLLGFWPGKLFVLALLGFAATDFVITITLSAADAAAHVIKNPYFASVFPSHGSSLFQMGITLGLIALLGAVFLKGFKEAIGIAVVLVTTYLGLNAIIVVRGILEVLHHPLDWQHWLSGLTTRSSNPILIIGLAVLLFPKLALGLSGFETGVAVMPLIRGRKDDNPENPAGRIRNAKNLLATAALIMSVFLISSAFVTTLLIPQSAFWPAITVTAEENSDTLASGIATVKVPLDDQNNPKEILTYQLPAGLALNGAPTKLTAKYKDEIINLVATVKPDGNLYDVTLEKPQGAANGTALSYLGHHFFGDGFGTIYDISSVLILWFAGASAMSALLSLVPRYLPRYGMAPEWAKANRPLTLLFILIAFIVTFVFQADVDTQSGAYATGVLVLMSSAAIAVFLSARAKQQRLAMIGFALITLVFIYTTVQNVIERPDGLRIALLFIATIVLVSILSRITRSTELRISEIQLDATADQFLQDSIHHCGELHIVTNKRQEGDWGEYQDKELAEREDHHIGEHEPVLFLEVSVSDASEFVGKLQVQGVEIESPNGQKYRVLRATAPAVPNAIAAFLLYVRDQSTMIPHCYFTWSEITPLANVSRFLFFGEGDTAPMTREIIRQSEPKPRRRPRVHVG